MGVLIDWSDIADRVFAVFFPPRCALCDEVVEYDDMWCKKCELPRFGEINCDNIPCRFAGALAATEYTGNVRHAIWRIKNKPEKRIFLFFAQLMQETIKMYWRDTVFDVVVPVPINQERLAARGFNQSEKLAEKLGGLIAVPIKPDALIRLDSSQVQHTLNRSERIENAAKAYDTGNTGGIEGKTVLLVDDVFTTGATLAACTDKLLEAGAKTVYVIAATAVKSTSEADYI